MKLTLAMLKNHRFQHLILKALNTSIIPTVSNSYEGYSNKFLLECFSDYFNSEEKAKELIQFMKSKRKVEKKYSLKRES